MNECRLEIIIRQREKAKKAWLRSQAALGLISVAFILLCPLLYFTSGLTLTAVSSLLAVLAWWFLFASIEFASKLRTKRRIQKNNENTDALVGHSILMQGKTRGVWLADVPYLRVFDVLSNPGTMIFLQNAGIHEKYQLTHVQMTIVFVNFISDLSRICEAETGKKEVLETFLSDIRRKFISESLAVYFLIHLFEMRPANANLVRDILVYIEALSQEMLFAELKSEALGKNLIFAEEADEEWSEIIIAEGDR